MISESYYSSDYKSLSNTTKLRKAKNKVRDGQFQMGKLEELINQKGKLGIDYPRKKEKSFQFSDRQINNHKSTNLYEQNRTKISTLTFKNDVLSSNKNNMCNGNFFKAEQVTENVNYNGNVSSAKDKVIIITIHVDEVGFLPKNSIIDLNDAHYNHKGNDTLKIVFRFVAASITCASSKFTLRIFKEQVLQNSTVQYTQVSESNLSGCSQLHDLTINLENNDTSLPETYVFESSLFPFTKGRLQIIPRKKCLTNNKCNRLQIERHLLKILKIDTNRKHTNDHEATNNDNSAIERQTKKTREDYYVNVECDVRNIHDNTNNNDDEIFIDPKKKKKKKKQKSNVEIESVDVVHGSAIIENRILENHYAEKDGATETEIIIDKSKKKKKKKKKNNKTKNGDSKDLTDRRCIMIDQDDNDNITFRLCLNSACKQNNTPIDVICNIKNIDGIIAKKKRDGEFDPVAARAELKNRWEAAIKKPNLVWAKIEEEEQFLD